MVSLERRERVASKRDLTTVVAKFWVLNRKSRPDSIRCVSPSVLSIAYCQRAPDTNQPVVKMVWVSSSRAN